LKALKYRDTWSITVEDVAMPQCRTDTDVIVEIAYTGICGTDIGIVTGDYPVALSGVTLGHESTGVIKTISPNVTNVAVGDRVVVNPTAYCGSCRMCRTLRINHCEQKQGTESGVSADGTYAHYYVTDSRYVIKLPDSVTLQAATFTEPLSCALTGLRKIPRDCVYENVVVIGAGPMGLLYTWALILNGYSPTVIEFAQTRRDYAREILDERVEVYETIRDYSYASGVGAFDLVVDTSSGLLTEIYELLSPGGTYLAIGLKAKSQTINSMQLADKSLNVLGSIDSKPGAFEEAFNTIVSGVIPIEKLVSHTFPLQDFQEAFSVLGCHIDKKKYLQPSQPCCKILLAIAENKF